MRPLAARGATRKRAAPRSASSPSAPPARLGPEEPAPELWNLYNAPKAKGESIRVFPISNWTELDVWQYIHLNDIPIVPLYFAENARRWSDGMLLMVDDDRFPLRPARSR
jgi:sulfate adenylyltransferase subunit 2